MPVNDPHSNARLVTAGVPLDSARAAMIMIHGRGSTAENILGLAAEFDQSAWAYLAPQAANNTWYPHGFLQPLERNEPHLSSALATLGRTVDQVSAAGVPAERIVLLGFSQGACLALEWAARNARRFGGVVALSGGVIGPEGTPRSYAGSLGGTPVFLGCSDIDAHIPVERFHESAAVFERLGAATTARLYPGMGHVINSDEIAFVQELLRGIGQ